MPISTLGPNALAASSVTRPKIGYAGAVLQVVSTAKTDTFTTTSTTYTDVTGLSVSITPSSASSRILVLVTTNYSNDSGGQNGILQLVRDSTAIFVGNSAGSRPQGSAQTRVIGDSNGALTIALTFLDSPSTTSSTNYKVQLRVQGGTGCVNRTNADTDTSVIARTASSITVMEIAG